MISSNKLAANSKIDCSRAWVGGATGHFELRNQLTIQNTLVEADARDNLSKMRQILLQCQP
jgi:hypothetical protein